jgi:superfamily I DNA/RNA helicase
MTKEIKLFGPPGTGKTTSLTRHIKEAVNAVGEDKVIATSFSKAAAQELVGRDLPIPKNHVGTLHSMAYHAIGGNVQIAETHIDGFNREYPQYRVPEQKASLIDVPEVAYDNENSDLLQQYNLIRARGVKVCNDLLDDSKRKAMVPRELGNFIKDYEAWKSGNDFYDFTDLLVIAAEDFDEHPSQPRVMFVDEVQDMNPLMMEVIRKWSRHTDYTILAGDDDQTIYGFMGASTDAFLKAGATEERVLSKSYRLPKEVKEWSERWIKQVKNRKEKEFTATELTGTVCRLHQTAPNATYRSPEKLLPSILKDISEGLTVMVLASCSFMLTPLISLMRTEGVPYSNRYRPSNGSWNPLPIGSEKRVPSWTRLMSFLTPVLGIEGQDKWTLNDWNCWKKDLSPKAAGLLPGVLKKTFTLHGSTPMDAATFLEGENETPPFYGSLEDALSWFLGALPSSKRKAYEFPARCVSMGRSVQVADPMVTVGTIHSVKGGEADSVYLFPDLSTTGARGYYGRQEDKDAVTRLMYVGATRAKQKLTLVGAYNAQLATRWTQ